MWNKLLVDGMADISTGSQISRSGNPPVKLRLLKNLLDGVPVSVRYIEIHIHDGRLLHQLTWNIININLLIEEGTKDTFVLLTCLRKICTRRRQDNSTNV